MKDHRARPALVSHWKASVAGDLQAETNIYADD